MTVRELCKVLFNPKKINIMIDEKGYELINKGCTSLDNILLDAFGDYIVRSVLAINENSFAIDVQMEPVKATK